MREQTGQNPKGGREKKGGGKLPSPNINPSCRRSVEKGSGEGQPTSKVYLTKNRGNQDNAGGQLQRAALNSRKERGTPEIDKLGTTLKKTIQGTTAEKKSQKKMANSNCQ